MPWGWGKKIRQQAAEAALRRECANLRYIGNMQNLSLLANPQIVILLDRVTAARDQLVDQMERHDDSPWRIVKFAAGLAIGATGLIGLAAAPPLAIAGVVGGFLLSADEARGIAETHLDILNDEALRADIAELQGKIRAIAKVRGLI